VFSGEKRGRHPVVERKSEYPHAEQKRGDLTALVLFLDFGFGRKEKKIDLSKTEKMGEEEMGGDRRPALKSERKELASVVVRGGGKRSRKKKRERKGRRAEKPRRKGERKGDQVGGQRGEGAADDQRTILSRMGRAVEKQEKKSLAAGGSEEGT